MRGRVETLPLVIGNPFHESSQRPFFLWSWTFKVYVIEHRLGASIFPTIRYCEVVFKVPRQTQNLQVSQVSCPLTLNRNHSIAFSGENHLYVDTRKKSLPGLEMLILLAKLFSISEASFDGSLVNPLIGSGFSWKSKK